MAEQADRADRADRAHTWACSCGAFRLRGGWMYIHRAGAYAGLVHHQATGCTGTSLGGGPATGVVASRPAPGQSLPRTLTVQAAAPGTGSVVRLV